MILVTGATGNAGGAVIRALVSSGERVRAVVRDADRARRRLQQLTGRSPRSFEAWVREHADAFR